MPLLQGFRVAQLDSGLAAAVCGRLLADVGASVTCLAADISSPLQAYLDHDKPVTSDVAAMLASADLLVAQGRPSELRLRGHDPDSLRARNPYAALSVLIFRENTCGRLAILLILYNQKCHR